MDNPRWNLLREKDMAAYRAGKPVNYGVFHSDPYIAPVKIDSIGYFEALLDYSLGNAACVLREDGGKDIRDLPVDEVARLLRKYLKGATLTEAGEEALEAYAQGPLTLKREYIKSVIILT